jgi:hypothetical protein
MQSSYFVTKKKKNDLRNAQFGRNIRIVREELAGRAMDEFRKLLRTLQYTAILLFRKQNGRPHLLYVRSVPFF